MSRARNTSPAGKVRDCAQRSKSRLSSAVSSSKFRLSVIPHLTVETCFRYHWDNLLVLACDVTDSEQIHAVVDSTTARFDRIDVLVNNAGISWGAPFEDMRLADWHKVIETNLTGTFLFSQAVGKVMIAQGRGKIINMASVAGMGGAPSEIVQATAYHASKGAVITLTKDLACKWAAHNIQVNAIAPGWFPTHMSDWVITHKRDRLLESIPSGRFGGEDDLKGAAVFLASDASAYVTGHVLVVDGGQSAW